MPAENKLYEDVERTEQRAIDELKTTSSPDKNDGMTDTVQYSTVDDARQESQMMKSVELTDNPAYGQTLMGKQGHF